MDALLDPPENLPPTLRGRLALLDTQPGLARLGAVIALLAFLAFAAFLATGANGPADPHTVIEDGGRAPVEGFGEVNFSVQRPGQLPSTTPFCALLAETPEAHRKGMMTRRDLGGYDAMVFRFAADQESQFYNRNVPIALSIAWFDGLGRFISSADMPPCEDREGCPLYGASAPYRYALEVPQGGLERLGIGPDAVLALGGSCTDPAPGDAPAG